MQYKQILWDNDGVLVDTERYYFQASREALEQLGLKLNDDQFATISLSRGKSIFDIAVQAGIDKDKIAESRQWRHHRYGDLLRRNTLAVDGAEDVLKSLYRKTRMAIVTSSLRDHFNIIHENTGFQKYIDFTLTREDYQNSKPSGEPYMIALEKSGVHAEEALVIEDSPRGLTAAKSAGLACWVIPDSYSERTQFETADRILDCIGEIPKALW